MNKKIFVVSIVLLVAGLLIVSIIIPQKEKEYKEDLLNIDYNIEGNLLELDYDKTNPIVAMYIKNYGSIVIELYPDIAPNTVNNFISLAKSGFYDDNSFHRLVPGFVLQGGDPDGKGSGGPGYTIKGEFKSNGFENSLLHEKWVVSMARSNDYDSAGSQFFICLDDAHNLDDDYATFGRVIDGFDNIEKIVSSESIIDSDSGKLRNNLLIKKAVVDLNNYDYQDVEKIDN